MNFPKKTNLRKGHETNKKKREVRGAIIADKERSAKDKVESDEQSENHLMDSLRLAKGDKTNTLKLSELFVSALFSITVPALSTLQYYQR